MHEKFLKPYDPAKTEDRIYKLWEESGFFNPDVCVEKGVTDKDAEAFSIVLPPPNVTGTLHMGSAFMLVIEDIIIRFQRMQGKKTLWLPGADHAGIATESKVAKLLQKEEGISKQELGREKFLGRVEKFIEGNRKTFAIQFRKLGSSLDWSREAYTLDEKRSRAVQAAFKRMYDEGLIYRGNRIVNWDTRGQTVISDDEIVRKEEKTNLYYLKYGPFTITTARPETKFGDKYVVMHPNDKRYKKYKHGDKIELEWINGPVSATVIKDKTIDMEFGTGVMTITPWHDATDFDIAQRHNLDKEQIIDKYGKLIAVAGEFQGMKITEAREKIVEKLKKKGLVEKVDENYVHQLATAERTGGTVEPQIMEQWFIDVNKKFPIPYSEMPGIKTGQLVTLKEIMLHVVREGHIKILPKRFEKIYFHWIENLRDWCISRQLYFGHRIPVWYDNKRKPHTLTSKDIVGFHERTVPQIVAGKTKTYRLRDYGLSVNDTFYFENSQSGEIFGVGTITNIEEVIIKNIPLDDETHGATYNKTEELIEAFRFHHPGKEINEKTAAWIYTYTFKSVELTQDPDTLDTWFSSGLWTFSTLGWPEQTSDLKTYHPTDVLETAYDILFFWVARMILMSGYHLGQIPFHTVYLHGLVRDKEGQKISKSLGNNLDPVDVVSSYGADAVRMSLIVGTGPGQDSKLSDDKFRAYKKFSNKIWNITRFILENIDDGFLNEKPKKLSTYDKKTLKELDSLVGDVKKDIEAYRLYLAAEKLYHYVWHTLADVIIEKNKGRLNGKDIDDRNAAQYVLYTILLACLKLLHPFMPFITEEIWQHLPHKDSELLMVTSWPTLK